MKAITLWQPHASLIAIKAKQIETRSWATSYRGPLAIHAAKTKRNIGLFGKEPFISVLVEDGGYMLTTLPFGAIVATCTLSSVVTTTIALYGGLTDNEKAFGDYSPGRFAWILEDRVKCALRDGDRIERWCFLHRANLSPRGNMVK